MKTILRVQAAMALTIALTACALLAPFGADDDARRGAKVTLAAYETAQQALLIYGRLPTCDPASASRICKDQALWTKIKAVEKAATMAINEAAPVLNGTEVDAGEIAKALAAIGNVKAAIKEAQAKLSAPAPGSS